MRKIKSLDHNYYDKVIACGLLPCDELEVTEVLCSSSRICSFHILLYLDRRTDSKYIFSLGL